MLELKDAQAFAFPLVFLVGSFSLHSKPIALHFAIRTPVINVHLATLPAFHEFVVTLSLAVHLDNQGY